MAKKKPSKGDTKTKPHKGKGGGGFVDSPGGPGGKAGPKLKHPATKTAKTAKP
jgi:hypothetical protein